MLIIKKNGKGKRIPAIGIQVTPKHSRRYNIWKIVKPAIALKGTVSTNETWSPSKILPR